MFPAFDSSEDAVGICGPDEGFWFGIGFQDEAIDGGLEIADGSEDAANESPSGELGEESLDRIEPRCGGRSEVELWRALSDDHRAASPGAARPVVSRRNLARSSFAASP